MFAKKLAITAVALAVSTPVLADRGDRGHGHGYGHRAKHHFVQHYYAPPRPVVHHYYHYRPAGQVVVVHRPAPVYHAQPAYRVDPHTGMVILAGAVLGAAIAHQVVSNY